MGSGGLPGLLSSPPGARECVSVGVCIQGVSGKM